MIQLDPQETFVICRQLDDPTDTNKYYVRAYIRNAKTDELLDTIDLTDQGDQRFRGEYQVPADVSGEGFYITITTKVYTDSGYTNESPNYAREENQYLVQKRYNPILGSGGGGGVDYKKLRRIVREVVREETAPIAQKNIDFNPVVKEIERTKKEIRKIKIPKLEKFDYAKIEKKVERETAGIIDKIKKIKIPEPEKLDLSEVIAAVNTLSFDIKRTLRSLSTKKDIAMLIGEIVKLREFVSNQEVREQEIKRQIKEIENLIGKVNSDLNKMKSDFNNALFFSVGEKPINQKENEGEFALQGIRKRRFI